MAYHRYVRLRSDHLRRFILKTLRLSVSLSLGSLTPFVPLSSSMHTNNNTLRGQHAVAPAMMPFIKFVAYAALVSEVLVAGAAGQSVAVDEVIIEKYIGRWTQVLWRCL